MTGIGRVALITGATGGLGRVVARDLARDGARVGLVGSDESRLAALAAELGLEAGRWAGAVADLRDREATASAAKTITERLGPPCILVHLVGGWTGGASLVDLLDADLAAMIDQHVWTTLNITRVLVPAMVAGGWGRVIAVSTPLAADPPARMAAYAVGKAAEEALLASLARDVAQTGVTVNVVRVRTIDTEHARERDPSARNAAWTTPEEISAAIRYLCSDEAGVVSGARLPMFGAG